MFRWEYAILEILYHSQGEADLREIYAALERSFPLENTDREPSWDERSTYQHVTRSTISKHLVKKGDLAWVSRGRYRLTNQGRDRFARERDDYTSG